MADAVCTLTVSLACSAICVTIVEGLGEEVCDVGGDELVLGGECDARWR